MRMIFKLMQIIICVLEAYLIVDFFMAFFKLKALFDRKYMEAGLILGAASCIRAVNMLNNTTLNMAAAFVVYLIIIVCFFQGKLLRKFLYFITVMIIMVGSEFLVIILLSLQTAFAFGTMQSGQLMLSVLTFVVKALAFVLLNIAKRVAESSDNPRINFKITLLYSIMPVSLIGIMIAIARLNIDFAFLGFTQVLLIVSCVLALIGSIAIFYFYDRYSQSVWRLQQQEIMITRLEMEERHYGRIEQVNQEHAAFLHDVRHYMKVIGEMAADNNDKAILQILSELQIKVSNTETEMLCQNHLLNAILNEKKKDAKRRGISVKIVVEPGFSVDAIADIDLIVIISNLLDNAIEAAEKCRNGYMKVSLFPRNENHFSIIKIVNNYVGRIEAKEGRLRTDKADRARHGFGLENVSDTVAKYGGYLQYFYRDGEFTAVVIMPVAAP